MSLALEPINIYIVLSSYETGADTYKHIYHTRLVMSLALAPINIYIVLV